MTIIDQRKRKIPITFCLPPDFPYSPPKWNAEIFREMKFHWIHLQSHLYEIVEGHQKVLPSYDRFWKEFEEIDSNLNVIDPKHPSLSSKHRIVEFSSSMWIRIEHKFGSQKSRPLIEFKGPEEEKRSLSQKYQSRIRQWDYEKSYRENLEIILEKKFPPKSKSEDIEALECGKSCSR